MTKKILRIISLLILTSLFVPVIFLPITTKEKIDDNLNNKSIKQIKLTKHYYAPFGELTTLENSEVKTKATLIPLVEIDNKVKSTKATEKPKSTEEPKVVVKKNNVVTKIYSNCPLSANLQKHIDDKCRKYGISTNIVIALIQSESNFKANTMGDYGRSYGLMQIQKRYHIKRMNKLNVNNLLDAYGNTTVGIDYLAEIYKSCNGNWHKALMVYNGGWNYAKRNINNGIYSTTYSRKVMQRANKYKSERNN